MAKKPGPKREPFERERDLVDVARLYLQGWTQQAIAEHISDEYYKTLEPLTQQQIGYDVKVLIKRWQKEQSLAIDEAKCRELSRIDKLEREYWEAWERSKQEFQSKSAKQKGAKIQKTGEDEITKTTPVEVTQKVEDRNGDPRYLAGVQWCIDRRCKIFGVDAATRNVNIDMSQLTLEQLERIAKGEDVYSVLSNPGHSGN